MKKLLFLVLALMTVAILAGCSNKKTTATITNADGSITYILSIYRSRDAGMTDGARDEAVKKAIEDKFFEDTGIHIQLDMHIYTNTDLLDIVDVNYNNKNKNIDAICHYLSEDSGSAIVKYAKDATATINLDPVLEQYGQNIIAKINENDEGHLADRAGYFNYNGTYYRTALSSVTKEGGFGIIMRKDLMEKVKSVTGLDPEDYDITNPDCKSMTVTQFMNVMKAIKEDTTNDVKTPLNGAPWDLARVVATAFGVDGMSGFGLDENGNFVPSQLTKNWDKYVDTMYTWARDGIWENESTTTTDDQRLTNLIAGKCAAYCAYPTAEQLISVSKKFYAANQTGELMVIAPFASEDGSGNALLNEDGSQVVNGNLKTQRSFYGLIVPYRSQNYEILIQYINWMYASAENYELCTYGVKGVDWVEGEDFEYGGVTYKTWEYPDDKVEEYMATPPYTGKYNILQNINVSNRISGHYSNVEKAWFTALYFEYPQFSFTETEGVWLPEIPRSLASQSNDIEGDYVDTIRSYAWAGIKYGSETPTQVLLRYQSEKRASCKEYLDYINEQYQAAISYFNTKYSK